MDRAYPRRLPLQTTLTAAAASPPPGGLMRIKGGTLTYLRPMKNKERISFLITGYRADAKDYDFRMEDTTSGADVASRATSPSLA